MKTIHGARFPHAILVVIYWLLLSALIIHFSESLVVYPLILVLVASAVIIFRMRIVDFEPRDYGFFIINYVPPICFVMPVVLGFGDFSWPQIANLVAAAVAYLAVAVVMKHRIRQADAALARRG